MGWPSIALATPSEPGLFEDEATRASPGLVTSEGGTTQAGLKIMHNKGLSLVISEGLQEKTAQRLLLDFYHLRKVEQTHQSLQSKEN